MTLSRRRFLKATGLAAASAALGSAAALEAAGRALAATFPQVSVRVSGTGLYAGPGNVDYRLVGTLGKGQHVMPIGLFGDFARVSAAAIRTPAGTLVRHTTSGYVLRTALSRLPAGLPTLAVAKVPWVARPLVASDRPIHMPSVGMLLDGYKTYPLMDGTWYAACDIRIDADLAFESVDGIPRTSSSGLYLQNITATRDESNAANLVLHHNGHPADLGWYVGYSPGTDWEFYDGLSLPKGSTSGRFTISVDSTGHVVTIAMPNGRSRTWRLRVPLFRRGDVLSLRVGDSPYTNVTARSVTLARAPLGTRQGTTAPYGSLRDAARGTGITIGAAFGMFNPGPDPRYEEIAASQFDLVVPGGEFNWDWLIRPDATHYNFAGADIIAGFAQRHGMRMRGYLLPSGSWEPGLPAWLKSGGYSRDQLLEIVHDHIRTVVGRYKGVVSEWLVASETIFRGAFVPWNFWLTRIGPDFIDKAYTWTREADPAAKLLYEFSSEEWAEPQSSAIYEHIADLRRRSVPVDLVGFEMHVFDGAHPPTKAQLLAAMKRLGTLGVKVQINEMDVNVYPIAGSRDQKLAAQAQVYRDALEALLESGVGDSFTTWGFFDPESWLLRPEQINSFGPAEAPVLFDDDYAPKPAYFALLDVLKKQAGLA